MTSSLPFMGTPGRRSVRGDLTPWREARRVQRDARKRARSGRQAVQVWPHPVRRRASSAPAPSLTRAATSWNVTPAHSHRVIARLRGAADGSAGIQNGRVVAAIAKPMILKLNFNFK